MGKPGSSTRALCKAVCLMAAAVGCRAQQSGPVAGRSTTDAAAGFSRAALLGALGSCVQESVNDFLSRTDDLHAAVTADPPVVETTRTAFRAALSAWQVLEPMQIGPAADSGLPGGKDLRNQIYSWPLVNPCAVDGELVSRGYAAPGFGASLVNRRGLAALEYLVFYDGADSQCDASSSLVTGGGWAALSTEERHQRRRAYAAAVATDLRTRARALADAWDDNKGRFRIELQTAGTGSSLFKSTQAALNAISDAVLYLDNEMKDMKLARPLGLRDCAKPSCPELCESRFAGQSKANLLANLDGVRRLLEGCGAAQLGFDDLLEAVGAGAVASSLRVRLAAAVAALQEISEPDLKQAVVQNPASVRAVHSALKQITDLLKTEFLTVLDLEIPKQLEGDND